MIYRGLTTHNTEHSQTFSNPCIIKCTKIPYDFPTNKTKIKYSTNLPQCLLHKEKNHFSLKIKEFHCIKIQRYFNSYEFACNYGEAKNNQLLLCLFSEGLKMQKTLLSLNIRRKESGNQLLFLAPP